MSDYKTRFAEEFKNATEELGLPHSQALRSRLLGFIEGECTEVGSRALYEGQKLGRAVEREELAAHVESMKLPDPRKTWGVQHPDITWDKCEACVQDYNFNVAFDRVLAHLHQSDAPLSETHCEKCIAGDPFLGVHCYRIECECHKKAPQGDNKQ